MKKTSPKVMTERARKLRKNSTPAERIMWRLLRDRRLQGWKFRRQHPLCGYILDFYCHEVRLAVELDGGHHAQKAQKNYDDRRDMVLASQGVYTLRFWNTEVENNQSAVLEMIYRCVKERTTV